MKKERANMFGMYVCGSCGKESWHSAKQFYRARGITCPDCGSRNMEKMTRKTKGKKDDLEEEEDGI